MHLIRLLSARFTNSNHPRRRRAIVDRASERWRRRGRVRLHRSYARDFERWEWGSSVEDLGVPGKQEDEREGYRRDDDQKTSTLRTFDLGHILLFQSQH